jgi:hypothetical protein
MSAAEILGHRLSSAQKNSEAPAVPLLFFRCFVQNSMIIKNNSHAPIRLGLALSIMEANNISQIAILSINKMRAVGASPKVMATADEKSSCVLDALLTLHCRVR